MSSEELKEKRSPRRITAPRLPPGPRQDLKELLYQLYLTAGAPTLDKIAQLIATDDELDGAPSRDTIARILGSSELPTNQHDVVAVATVLAREARWDVDIASTARELWVKAAMIRPVGRPLGEVTDTDALEQLGVHSAIEVAGSANLPPLPPYLQRDFDRQLRQRIGQAVAGKSVVVVLVGGSSTGKTRACWEAIKDERLVPPHWRVWHPLYPSGPEAVLKELERIEPSTVIWLDDAQDYLLTEGSDLGERVAARLRTILIEPGWSPILVLATIWRDSWSELIRPDTAPSDPHRHARQLLTGHDIPVPESFSEQLVESLKAKKTPDPRLLEAAKQAQDGELAQYLAGAPALLNRYQTAPPAPKALLTAAMDIRRLGHGAAIPQDLLEAGTPAYLTDRQWQNISQDPLWFDTALAYAGQRCHGDHRPLSRIWARPGEPEPARVSFRLADYLDQIGRQTRRRRIIPTGLWQALVTHVQDPTSEAEIGNAAAQRMLYSHAIPLLRRAADNGMHHAGNRLADLLAERRDVNGLRRSADAGDEYAAFRLADLLIESGDVEGLRRTADAGNQYAAERLAELLVEWGDVEGLRRTAKAGNEHAAYRLAELLIERGQVDEAISVLRLTANAGDKTAARWQAALLVKRGDVEEAISILRRTADAGDPKAASRLAEMLVEYGDIEGLRQLAEAGNLYAVLGLAYLVPEDPELRDGLRQRAGPGNLSGALRLAEEGDLDGLRRLANAENLHAALRLAELQVERGDVEEAMEVLGRQADAGHRDAAEQLAKLLAQQGDVERLSQWADAGHRDAAEQLAKLLAQQGNLERLSQRAGAGDEQAAHSLANLLAARGDENAIRLEVLRGNLVAPSLLIDLVAEHNSPAAAERLRRDGLNFDGTMPGHLAARVVT